MISLPTSFLAYYSVVATDVGVARISYASAPITVSSFKIFSPTSTSKIGCRYLALGY